jgi:hypothetical protein
VPPVSSERAFVRSADVASSKLMLVVSATPVRWSVPMASRSLPALGPPENSGYRC